ncbi:hypothetical protein ACN38_g4913 [Penicillium nordicum]|uniref:Uncharacterized protein n=1 Tax=Penicillium nordicum TaxID=229535 RepID=A0A0M8P5X2_9EURO|nr:hypothetical protein ACN38_g4913 [Penicillium nordicum]
MKKKERKESSGGEREEKRRREKKNLGEWAGDELGLALEQLSTRGKFGQRFLSTSFILGYIRVVLGLYLVELDYIIH